MTFAFFIDSVPFTKAVIAGETSLGGSESACLGLARALRRRGHEIHIFTTKLDEDAEGLDATGLQWHPLREFYTMNAFIEWDVVCSLRMFTAFAWRSIHARLRILWCQDLMVPGQMQHAIMGMAWGVDQLAYVSEYHRQQWEALEPDLHALGWVTRNGFDPAHVPASSTKDPNRIIHISRPERGLAPILAMWPALRALKPDATLQICRYSSMYDQGPGSWSDTCAAYDRHVAQVNDAVGGITYLGELNKPDLYQAISDAAVMWYPGIAGFAETSCIAAVEAQACGTPFVGSLRGALPETAQPSYEAGLLIAGDAERDEAYQQASIAAVVSLLDGCRTQSFAYRRLQRAGLKHVERYTYDVLADEWEAQITQGFAKRYEANTLGVLRQLLHEDDHVAARVVAEEIFESVQELDAPLSRTLLAAGKGVSPKRTALARESYQAIQFCKRVIDGKDQDADHYASQALDPMIEAEHSERFKAVVPLFAARSSVLDVACGNGSFAIALAKENPTIHIYGLDYAQGNIDRAREAAEKLGIADRCTFERLTVYDYDAHALHSEWHDWVHDKALTFDGLFVGEFIEHTANYRAVIDGLEVVLEDGAQVVYTCPCGNCAELVPRGVPLKRGHVHKFHADDLKGVWGPKLEFSADYLGSGITERGTPLGNWVITYRMAAGRLAGERPLQDRIRKTRPLQKVTVGLIVKDAENDLGRCLASIYKIADEILVGDTGSTDTSKAIAASYGARVLDLDPVENQPEGFAGARNQVLHAATGDWFLWIDADEVLLEAHLLRRYLDGVTFAGYVIPQTHLYIDAAPTFDMPVRLFRNTGRVRFYGCIHEQPQDGDPNRDLLPTLHVADLKIAHTGYLTEDVREDKRVHRNLPLLRKDAAVFPDRQLGKVLLLREAVIQADAIRARHGGQMIQAAQQGYAYAVRMFIDHFDDPGNKFAALIRPWYEAALRHLGMGWEVEFAMAGRAGGLQQTHAKPERIWVRDAAEYQQVLVYRITEAAKKMVPVDYHTEPFAVQVDEPEPAVHSEAVTA